MNLSNDGLVAFHYRSYGTFFLHKNRLHNIHRGFTHYKYYRADKCHSDKISSFSSTSPNSVSKSLKYVSMFLPLFLCFVITLMAFLMPFTILDILTLRSLPTESVGILNGCFLYIVSCTEVPHAQTRQIESVRKYQF